MKKSLIISITLVLTISLLMLIASNVFAASTTYGSYLQCGANSTVTGSTRNYPQRNHQISITPTQVSGNGDMKIRLVKKNWLSTTTVYSTESTFSVGETQTIQMGNHDTGDFYYYFSTYGYGYGALVYADPVYMTCYD
ncbi:MAG: hypothetical protein J6M60_00430 [Clostridia bacterium]|nr:hypothetical protein [Clostridia bacterium]